MLAVVACEPHKLEVGECKSTSRYQMKSFNEVIISLHFYLKCRKYFKNSLHLNK